MTKAKKHCSLCTFPITPKEEQKGLAVMWSDGLWYHIACMKCSKCKTFTSPTMGELEPHGVLNGAVVYKLLCEACQGKPVNRVPLTPRTAVRKTIPATTIEEGIKLDGWAVLAFKRANDHYLQSKVPE
jgi:hypothetical protein